jgi:hypothetical protein
MRYTEKDIDFAWRLLFRRREIDPREIQEWLRHPLHVELMDDLAALREKHGVGQSRDMDGERERVHRAIRRARLQGAWRRASVAIVFVAMASVSLLYCFSRDAAGAGALAPGGVIHPRAVKAPPFTGMGESEWNARLNTTLSIITKTANIRYNIKGKEVIISKR